MIRGRVLAKGLLDPFLCLSRASLPQSPVERDSGMQTVEGLIA